MKKLISFKQIIISFSFFYLLFVSSFYFTLNYFHSKSAKELVNNWYLTHRSEILAGNLLSSLSQNNSYLQSSELLNGLSAYAKNESSEFSEILSYGLVEPLKNLDLSQKGLQVKGLFEKEIILQVENDIALVFFISGSFYNAAFGLGSSFIFLTFLVALFYLYHNLKGSLQQINEKNKAYDRLSKQVAHDIRSPLATLISAIESPLNIESNRQLIRSATNRIQDIATHLIDNDKRKNIDKAFDKKKQNEQTEIQNLELSSAILSLVSEKRSEYQHISDLSIDFSLSSESYGAFARVEPVELKRCLSNIINNSVEAIKSQSNISSGVVTLKLIKKDQYIFIEVQDNGPGIASEFIEKVKEEGFSAGKKKGHGLGLFHANQLMKSLDGDLSIDSSSKGTCVILKFKAEAVPKTFVEKIYLNPSKWIFVLDDDQSIHRLWKQRLKQCNFPSDKVEFFSKPQQLLKKISDFGEFMLFCDFEFKGLPENGLDFLAKLDKSRLDQSYLITSYFEERQIQKRCKQLGIKLIDKNMLGFIDLKLEKICTKVKTVLVDDDALIRKLWQSKAKQINKEDSFKAYTNSSELLSELDQYTADTYFYLDVKLDKNDDQSSKKYDGNYQENYQGESGLDLAHKLFQKGYKHIYLATGYRQQDLDIPNYIVKVVDKTPQFSGI